MEFKEASVLGSEGSSGVVVWSLKKLGLEDGPPQKTGEAWDYLAGLWQSLGRWGGFNQRL